MPVSIEAPIRVGMTPADPRAIGVTVLETYAAACNQLANFLFGPIQEIMILVGPQSGERMPKRQIDRSTLRFVNARRGPRGIVVTASFEAPKSTSGVGLYNAQVTIDPLSNGLVSCWIDLQNRAGGTYASPRFRSKDTQWDIARDVADIFMKTLAWNILVAREPEWDYLIDQKDLLFPVF